MSRESDIEQVCESILETYEDHSSNSGYHCLHCDGHYTDTSTMSKRKFYRGKYHSIDCIVFIVQDLLTEGEK